MRVIPEGARAALLLVALGSSCAHDGPPRSVATGVHAVPAPIAPEDLVLRTAVPIEADEDFQPSGLLVHEGRLLTVSDKHDAAVYALDIEGGVARARPFVEFAPPADEPDRLDFEGLTESGDGGWLLVSESRYRVLHIEDEGASPSGVHHGVARWLTPSLLDVGRARGCFGVENAGLEGITWLDGGGLLLAIERDPRGLIELGPTRHLGAASVWALPGSVYPVPGSRGTDFTDLTRAGDAVYALVRNSHLIVRLERQGASSPVATLPEPAATGWVEGSAFSYAQAENDPRYSYESHKYGLAEGLAITAREVFVVLDNNGLARASSPTDHRALLLVFERPTRL